MADEKTTVRRLTVSELIRESRPDWKPVHVQYKHANTQPFSGPLTVDMPSKYSWTTLDGKPQIPMSFEEQVEHQLRQMSGEEPLASIFGEEIVEIPSEEDQD